MSDLSFSDAPLTWLFLNVFNALPNIFTALYNYNTWLDWISWDKTTEDKQSLMRFIYYGASIELFFATTVFVFLYTAIAIYHRPLMWKTVTSLETLANTTGRFFCMGRANYGINPDCYYIYTKNFRSLTNYNRLRLSFFL